MARSPEMSQYSMSVPETRFIGEVRVEAQVEDPNPYKYVATDEVDKHETDHALVARKLGIGVKKVTVIPNFEEGYLGATYVDQSNPVVAAASIANGREGTWGDEAAIGAMRANKQASVNAAKEITDKYPDEANVLAQALHVHKTLYQADIDHALALKKEVVVFVRHPNGQTEVHKGIEPKDKVLIPGEWVKLESPASEINPN